MLLLLMIILAIWVWWRIRLRRTRILVARNLNAANQNFKSNANIFDGEFEEVKDKH
ncbi:hypothetical protein [Weissella hellenica]|uniref:Uncharacterized protein n=1 Tax=Weissella hellenica TaxID=46256 RepID=A0A4Y4G8E9_WEIHE|nr:hypothetical protein [Weissella hellenica]NKY67341.1 hypothetical protein [Weissella hellenica]GED36420.1 hypothetical protein WHE01_13240 [Weissella hellenica]SCC03746.1 hypothetical protein GA0061075_1128 [Weissella hellenica]